MDSFFSTESTSTQWGVKKTRQNELGAVLNDARAYVCCVEREWGALRCVGEVIRGFWGKFEKLQYDAFGHFRDFAKFLIIIGLTSFFLHVSHSLLLAL